jgi:hypothetical protein
MNPTAAAPVAKPTRRRWLRRLALLAAGLLTACLLGELAVLLLFGEQVKFPRHVVEAPWGLRYNDPNSSYRHKSADGSWRFRINGQGMRDDREFARAKPAGTRRIVSLGDSFTVGYEVDADQTFSAVLERELRARGRRVEVLNAGVSGFSNAEECLYLERELLAYEPDVVLVSFFFNDLVDNVRSGLFRLEGGRLLPWNERYVPAGRLADFLNRSWFFNLLSERSNLFVFAKERLTLMLKRDMVVENERNLAAAGKAGAAADEEVRGQRQLAAAIFERMYGLLRERGIPLVIHSIPGQSGPWNHPLEEVFPLDEFPTQRPGLLFVPAKKVLDPLVGKEVLYRQRSHFHWTPLAHELAAKELARAVMDAGLLAP